LEKLEKQVIIFIQVYELKKVGNIGWISIQVFRLGKVGNLKKLEK